jgi:hypothetical protein
MGWLSSVVLCAQLHAEPTPSPAALCVSQAERAQEFFHAGDIAQARAEVALCAQPHCPTLVRNDCESWLHEWDQPVASSRPPSADVVSPEPAREANPGHSSPPDTRTTTVPIPQRGGAPDDTHSPVWPWILTAVGVAGGASFTYWGLTGRQEAEVLADTCGVDRSCTKSQVDPVRTKLIVADVSLGLGVVALGAAIWGFAVGGNVSRPSEADNSRTSSSDTAFDPTVEFRGSSLTARLVF